MFITALYLLKTKLTVKPKMVTLCSYHGMIVSKYLKTIRDFIILEFVCKKFYCNMKKFHYNPIPLNHKTIFNFPHVETLHLFNVKDETFGNGIIIIFNVGYTTVDMNKNKNFIFIYIFKNVTFTKNDRKKFGNAILKYVKKIGDHCFGKCKNMNSVEISFCVTLIGGFCFMSSHCIFTIFYRCKKLSTIYLPPHILSISNCCFSKCSGLINITTPLHVKSFGHFSLGECTSLSHLDLPTSVLNIGNFCFFACCSPSDINIPSSVTSIGHNRFHCCTNLTSVILSSQTTSIEHDCFYKFSTLNSIILPMSVTSIAEYCF
ncbi:hypothetical protein EIN_474520 [Entamoeba invadens IP1]|uniref:Leucine rich repeat containing protein BspA family protein n=1 Tax=Entamoeba invadens IP1 TaxID=370355 RepID=A0A0A1U9P9_ENTIV|nr:hypothetical protein EIN_474520 [Entamoeba invadens IP1]ELP88850.1 hypothetical protein EIN_474520 [Entamoeba invadens IP1]|eukprot:XP_004255621.1 hypothetical protein EIN_474520 [Entamoeba invadens IP1]